MRAALRLQERARPLQAGEHVADASAPVAAQHANRMQRGFRRGAYGSARDERGDVRPVPGAVAGCASVADDVHALADVRVRSCSARRNAGPTKLGVRPANAGVEDEDADAVAAGRRARAVQGKRRLVQPIERPGRRHGFRLRRDGLERTRRAGVEVFVRATRGFVHRVPVREPRARRARGVGAPVSRVALEQNAARDFGVSRKKELGGANLRVLLHEVRAETRQGLAVERTREPVHEPPFRGERAETRAARRAETRRGTRGLAGGRDEARGAVQRLARFRGEPRVTSSERHDEARGGPVRRLGRDARDERQRENRCETSRRTHAATRRKARAAGLRRETRGRERRAPSKSRTPVSRGRCIIARTHFKNRSYHHKGYRRT